jgi:hypothetical protein
MYSTIYISYLHEGTEGNDGELKLGFPPSVLEYSHLLLRHTATCSVPVRSDYV